MTVANVISGKTRKSRSSKEFRDILLGGVVLTSRQVLVLNLASVLHFLTFHDRWPKVISLCCDTGMLLSIL